MLLKELIVEYEEESKHVAGKDIYLLLGPSGAGKSTTIHYLAGSVMQK
jgi:ABC-type multidrug transport system ATPase subunit